MSSFGILITLNLLIDPSTGNAYCGYRLNTGKPMTKIEYDPKKFCVPEQFRRFTDMKGSHLYHYINEVSEDTYYCTANNMLLNYPSWSSVSERMGGGVWTENDHNAFEEALEWFSSKECFLLTWCY